MPASRSATSSRTGCGWQEYAIGGGPAAQGRSLASRRSRPPTACSGMPGMTAYFGLLDVGQPKAGRDHRACLRRLGRGRPGGGPDRQDHGLPRCRHRRRRQEMRVREGRSRLRCLHRLQGREGPRCGAACRLPQRHRRLFRQCRRRDLRRRAAQPQLLRAHRALRLDLAVQRHDRRRWVRACSAPSSASG